MDDVVDEIIEIRSIHLCLNDKLHRIEELMSRLEKRIKSLEKRIQVSDKDSDSTSSCSGVFEFVQFRRNLG